MKKLFPPKNYHFHTNVNYFHKNLFVYLKRIILIKTEIQNKANHFDVSKKKKKTNQ